MPDNPNDVPPVRTPETEGLPHKRRDEMDTDKGGAPVNPTTSGEAPPAEDPLREPFRKRGGDAPDQPSVTPRPTENPIGD